MNPYIGLFFFDGRFRPVPLSQTFIGVKQVNPMRQRQDMDEICYDKCVDFLKNGHQVMVFVHARNATVNTAIVMKEMAQQNGETALFLPEELRSTMPNMDPLWMLVSWTSSRYLVEQVDLSLTSLAMVSSSLPMTNLLTICLF